MVQKIFVMIAIASGVVLAACNTVEGAGEDVQSVGKTVENAAK